MICQMCGTDGTDWSMSDWIAHRLESFDAHFPWKASRFLGKGDRS